MALIFNTLEDETRVTIGGNTFSFAPKQIKFFHNEDIAKLIVRNKADSGLIDVPDDLEYLVRLKPGTTLEDTILPEHKVLLDEKRVQGIANYVKDLRSKVYNAQVSLSRDLARANFKHDVKHEFSEGDIQNMEQLAKYQAHKEDQTQNRVERAKILEKKLAEQSRG